LFILEEKTKIVSFPYLFRVSNDALKVKKFSINECFTVPGRLFKSREFDILNSKKDYEDL
jgi:hypothetical protein